jgi:hypothetical protein
MDERMAACAQGPKSASAHDLKEWHIQHIYRIRQFVQDHPSHALVEFDIEDETTGELFSTLFHENAQRWGHSNGNTPRTTLAVASKKRERRQR